MSEISVDPEQKFLQAKTRQMKGEAVEKMEEAGINVGGNERPSEYAVSAKKIVDKMVEPTSEEDKQLFSDIPKNILPNTMMLVGIENAIDKLYTGDLEIFDPNTKKVHLYLNSDNQVGQDGNVQDGLIHYRTVTAKGYAQAKFWKQYWHGLTGNLFMQLPAVEGKRAGQGVTMVGSITNSDRALLEAQNGMNAGFFRKAWDKTFGSGKRK